MKNILETLEDSRFKYDNVPCGDGQYLKELMIKTRRKSALEIGSANGYSAIWIGLGVKVNNGMLHTIEINRSLVNKCRENIHSAGLTQTVNCIEGNAKDEVKTLRKFFDFLFLDLGPVDMLPILKAVEPKLTDNALIAIHNLNFEQSYTLLFQYASSKGWLIDREHTDDCGGYGFFLITKTAAKRHITTQ
ncbi:class I SAM-dependent methyltransferase [uncultured Desulfobacter sp.]|uniref:O-methyltransferase n=1 Tax=uncultured Desulfobacter sp. TaxID=240139 RepID=UPI002AA70830|nr:class I SAM-dependent methyltransferase [uncultured Desulfobacter sp.]